MCRKLIFLSSLVLVAALVGYASGVDIASNPSPRDGQAGVDSNTTLTWSPGSYAISHDVYLGTVFDDVNEANTTSSIYKGRQVSTTYNPEGLVFDTIYYWRIDEINDTTVWKGDVWSFGTACEDGLLNDFTPVGILLVPTGNMVYDAIPLLNFKVSCMNIPKTFEYNIMVDNNQFQPRPIGFDPRTCVDKICFPPCEDTCRVRMVWGLCWLINNWPEDCMCTASTKASLSPDTTDTTAAYMAENLNVPPGSRLEIVFDPNNLIPEYDENNNHFKTIMVDYFESYQTDANLQADWNNVGKGQAHLWTEVYDSNMHSMKVDYNNSTSPYYSEVVRVYSSPQDWTWDTINSLEFWVRGTANNNAQPMYVVVKDANNHTAIVEYSGDQNDVKYGEWRPLRIAFQEFSDKGVDMTKVKELSIGFGYRVSPIPSGAGTVYIDNIGLFPTRCLHRPSGDLNDDCVVNFKDFAIMANDWLKSGIFP